MVNRNQLYLSIKCDWCWQIQFYASLIRLVVRSQLYISFESDWLTEFFWIWLVDRAQLYLWIWLVDRSQLYISFDLIGRQSPVVHIFWIWLVDRSHVYISFDLIGWQSPVRPLWFEWPAPPLTASTLSGRSYPRRRGGGSSPVTSSSTAGGPTPRPSPGMCQAPPGHTSSQVSLSYQVLPLWDLNKYSTDI